MKIAWKERTRKSHEIKIVLRVNRANSLTAITWTWEKEGRDGNLDTKMIKSYGTSIKRKRKEGIREINKNSMKIRIN